MDPQTRSDLSQDVHNATLFGVNELQQVNNSIEEAQFALDELREKKRFVGVRLAAYQEKLEHRSKHLQREHERLTGGIIASENDIQLHYDCSVQEETESLVSSCRSGKSPGVIVGTSEIKAQDGQNDNDEESGSVHLSIDEVQKQRAQLHRDQEALEKIEKSQIGMETKVRELQKKIFVLERRRDEILQKTGECRDFLVAAAHVEHEQGAEDDDTVHSYEDVEEGHLEGDDSTGDGEFVVIASESNEEPHLGLKARQKEEDEKDK